MSAPVMLTINVNETATSSLNAELETRLNGSPKDKTPAELAKALDEHRARTERLRKAHLDAVRDRAARESQRASEAASRKLRLAASRVDKVQRKMSEAETKTNAKKEATEAKRQELKARRAEMGLAVAEARKSAIEKRAARQSELLEAEKQAFFKHAKNVQAVVDRSHWQVKHAIAVAAAQKEKEAQQAVAAGEKLAERLEKAAAKAGTPSKSADEMKASTSSGVRHRIYNDEKVAGQMRKIVFDNAMAKAVSKREALLQQKVDKASAENARIQHVAQQRKNPGSDDTAAASKALYDRLLRAEVSRITALKAKSASGRKMGDTVSVIVVRVDKPHPRMPPAALSLRLSAVPTHLVSTAAARQRGAASRRAAIKALRTLKAALANEKRAAALGRIGKRQAEKAAAFKAREARSMVTLALGQGASVFKLAQASRRLSAAAVRRSAAAAKRDAAAEERSAKGKDADERHAAKLRAVAKKGVVTVRAAAFNSRRAAYNGAIAARGASHAARATAAAAKRAGLLAARVEVARKLGMAAPHPKREVADMEIKAE